MVKSQIIKANGEPVKVDYMMRRNGEGWLISDIYLDGAVSEVATRRTECAFHIRDGRHWTAEYGIERKIELLRVAGCKNLLLSLSPPSLTGAGIQLCVTIVVPRIQPAST